MVIHFDLAAKSQRIEILEKEQLAEGFWDNYKKAQNVVRELKILKDYVQSYEHLKTSFQELEDVYEMLKVDADDEMQIILEEDFKQFEKEMEDFEIKVLLSNEYDQSNCVLELHPGAGGTESCDWCEMLYRMYTKYAENKGFKVTVLDYLPGEVAGIKSVTVLVEGEMAYGYLKGEKGVHRLVRISPFDSGGRRHTSFASVDVIPEFNDDVEIDLEDKDLEIDTMRSSGAGGQHVNKTDSAVRITHIPTGISVKCQSGRSQHDNKEQAMLLLKSKLYQLQVEEQMKKVAEIKGDQKLIEWGSQIRSYVFQPYKLVKDNRTNYETTDVQGVMDGKLDDFIFAYLKSLVK
ncbi:peptide chain release factor 2 [Breznakia sp. PF5-3]|nr:peptide chain release factor 2 [Breznakia sp. PM6-1]MDF9835452.1 peptide chain release factor 2 [Breznakia sp. PF5-3]MDF9837862.1 peptide chain release factor 2 [Breznakia sp. PFB2-8]MDF9859845.1 peptide chain release factor 2 [Breznakia sp. PH5-24]